MRVLGGIFDYDGKLLRLEVVSKHLEDPAVWEDQDKAQALGQERSSLGKIIEPIDHLTTGLQDLTELLEMAIEEQDSAAVLDVEQDVEKYIKQIEKLEFQRMFSHEMDPNNAYVDIQAGSGGTEAQDWAEMLLRMYLRWGDQHGFKAELMECSSGEVAGIKSATVRFVGDYAYGWLRTESGVHRLVRKSPFDSGSRRHTSFASLFVAPEISDDVEIELDPSDLRIDTYRASGAGGQHVNTTDSAVRITHVPTDIVVQCQSDRSQHKNKAQAMKQLRAKLYEFEMSKKTADQKVLEDSKMEISWGSQIRSYVLDASRIKDLRTSVETSNTQAVLDGDLDQFIEASLKQGV